jgi:hypothetical protein
MTQPATITVVLPHRDAVRLGVAQIRYLTVGPDTPQADRDEIARHLSDSGKLPIHATTARHLAGAADIAAIAAAYRAEDLSYQAAVAAAEAAAADRKRAAVAELAAILAERRTQTQTNTVWVHGRESGSASWVLTRPASVWAAVGARADLAPDEQAQWDAWAGELAAASQAARDAAERRAHQEADAQTAAREARERALAAIVREHGSSNQIGRLTAGLLSEREQLRLAEDAAFAPLAAYRHAGDDFEGERKATATAMEWDGLQMIVTAARASGMEATCLLATGPGDRQYVRVTLAYRGLTLSRAYVLPIAQAQA